MDQVCSAGYKLVVWDGKSDGIPVASGLYFYRVEIEGQATGHKFHQVRKMMMLK